MEFFRAEALKLAEARKLTEWRAMQDQTTVRINIARYRCLFHRRLDEYMRRALNEMLFEEEARTENHGLSRRWIAGERI